MDAAKDGIKKFMSKSGQHDTTIHETMAPAVQNETVTRQQHEIQTQAVDHEVHQDHYHTSEQPVHHSEMLPEQHHHKTAEVQHRSFEHDDHSAVKERLAHEQSTYGNTKQHIEGENRMSSGEAVAGEHVHHHVHETIQPVVNKQTIEPHVVHTTVPIHEVHHNASQHHSASALPPVSMEDFKKHGGSLAGREERSDAFPGEPRSFGGDLREAGSGSHHSSGMGSGTHTSSGMGSGTHNSSGMSSGIHNSSGGVGSGTHNSSAYNSSGMGSGTHSSSGGVGSDSKIVR